MIAFDNFLLLHFHNSFSPFSLLFSSSATGTVYKVAKVALVAWEAAFQLWTLTDLFYLLLQLSTRRVPAQQH
eukprot:79115-Amphidinium_carterae.1